MKKALFLDRDGILNEERGDYTFLEEDFRILPHVAEAILKARESGFLIIVISNQGGIAKGLYSAEEVENLHKTLCNHLSENKAHIDGFYYCPHHDSKGKCLCRKPGSLMFEKAMARFNIDASKSWMIGDSERDIAAAEKVGIKGVLVSPNQDLLSSVESLL
jgi:D-glycero-D-manno-heptose 1,7-bisphosphate phosphatase